MQVKPSETTSNLLLRGTGPVTMPTDSPRPLTTRRTSMRTRTVCLAATVLLGLAPVIRAADEVKEGQPAPDFSLQATNASKIAPGKKDGDPISLKDVKEKNIVLFFYPKAMTRGCTVESCGFRDRVKKFEELDTVVIG